MVQEKITVIHASGTGMLSDEEKKKVNELLERYHQKIQRHFDEAVFLELHVKEYNIEGTRKKYSLHVRLHGTKGRLEADAHDWELARTVHKVMKKLLEEIEHMFRVSEKRGGGKRNKNF